MLDLKFKSAGRNRGRAAAHDTLIGGMLDVPQRSVATCQDRSFSFSTHYDPRDRF